MPRNIRERITPTPDVLAPKDAKDFAKSFLTTIATRPKIRKFMKSDSNTKKTIIKAWLTKTNKLQKIEKPQGEPTPFADDIQFKINYYFKSMQVDLDELSAQLSALLSNRSKLKEYAREARKELKALKRQEASPPMPAGLELSQPAEPTTAAIKGFSETPFLANSQEQADRKIRVAKQLYDAIVRSILTHLQSMPATFLKKIKVVDKKLNTMLKKHGVRVIFEYDDEGFEGYQLKFNGKKAWSPIRTRKRRRNQFNRITRKFGVPKRVASKHKREIRKIT